MTYQWSCATETGAACVNATGGTFTSFDEPVLQFSGQTWANGTFEFTLLVQVVSNDNITVRNTSTSVTIDMASGSFPSLDIAPLALDKYNPEDGTYVDLMCNLGGAFDSLEWVKTSGTDIHACLRARTHIT